MNSTYIRKRLADSLTAMRKAADPCARIAHSGMVQGYRSLLAKRSDLRKEPPKAAPEPTRQDNATSELARAVEEWSNEGGSGEGRRR
ncbi:hypothetical protein CLG96_05525 [Sphingomonas oleivorans]|uniref:Uncharacterized protein n=1 Tax=Sphingomonas oleivorans TaxID=1735121 RepID=A0A2T5FZA8_9SPHN|nr:hypothetical protein CLG96_05525 [Sphingomonas oleivorans]